MSQEYRLHCNAVCLISEIIQTSADHEVSLYTPVVSPRIANQPVLCLAFLVETPANHKHRVSGALPLQFIVRQCVLREILFISNSSNNFFPLSLRKLRQTAIIFIIHHDDLSRVQVELLRGSFKIHYERAIRS